jgi:actin-like ATPase involved in cell morphogenesis
MQKVNVAVLTSEEIRAALEEPMSQIIGAIRSDAGQHP